MHRHRPFPAQVRNGISSLKNRAFRNAGNRASQSRGCNCDLRNKSDPQAARARFSRANPMVRVTISRQNRHLASPMISRRIVCNGEVVSAVRFAGIRRAEGETRAAGAYATISAPNGTNRKQHERTKACDESSITAACYLCNTLPKTAVLAPFRAVPLLRVHKRSVIVSMRRRGASRGRPVRWFA
jgi:hypothetical protein